MISWIENNRLGLAVYIEFCFWMRSNNWRYSALKLFETNFRIHRLFIHALKIAGNLVNCVRILIAHWTKERVHTTRCSILCMAYTMHIFYWYFISLKSTCNNNIIIFDINKDWQCALWYAKCPKTIYFLLL